MWSYLGIVFELLIETVAWERWEGTIEYTFMAPFTRATHLLGTGIFAIVYGIVRATIVFIAIAAFFGLNMPNATSCRRRVLLGVASISFVGIGMMTAVLPLISPEKGTQFGYVAQGLMLVVSGVYYPVSVLPRVHAVDLEDLAGDICVARRTRRDPRRCDRDAGLGRHLADADHRRHLRATRHLGVPSRRDACQEAWEAQAIRLRRRLGGVRAASTPVRP